MRWWSVALLTVVVAPQAVRAQGFYHSAPGGLHRVVIPPAEAQVPVAQGLTRVAPSGRPSERAVPPPSEPRAGSSVGERKAALPPPPPKEELAFAPAAIAAGPAASGLATGGLAFAPLVGLVGIAGVGAAAAVAGGGGGSGPVATVSTR